MHACLHLLGVVEWRGCIRAGGGGILVYAFSILSEVRVGNGRKWLNEIGGNLPNSGASLGCILWELCNAGWPNVAN